MRFDIRALRLGVSTAAVFALGSSLNTGFAQSTTPQALTNQPSLTYNVKTITYDLWCLETQHYPADRCQKRMPADVMAFEDYRDAVERYELQYLKQVEQNRAADVRANRDPMQTERTKQDTPAR